MYKSSDVDFWQNLEELGKISRTTLSKGRLVFEADVNWQQGVSLWSWIFLTDCYLVTMKTPARRKHRSLRGIPQSLPLPLPRCQYCESCFRTPMYCLESACVCCFFNLFQIRCIFHNQQVQGRSFQTVSGVFFCCVILYVRKLKSAKTLMEELSPYQPRVLD